MRSGESNSAAAGAVTDAWDDERVQVQQLYRDHAPALVRQLTRKTGCGELARELTQETFLGLLRAAPGILARIERPEAYLRTISTNLLHKWRRAQLRRDQIAAPADLCGDDLLDQVAALESRETLRRLEQAVLKLKPKTREIFLAQRIEGLSYAEIAQRTGLSIKGVEKQMSKAIAKIDRLLDRA